MGRLNGAQRQLGGVVVIVANVSGILASKRVATCQGHVHVAVVFRACRRQFLCILIAWQANCFSSDTEYPSATPPPADYGQSGLLSWPTLLEFHSQVSANNKRATASDKWGNWRRLAGATCFATGFGCHFVYLLLILCTRNDICAARVCVRGILCPFSQSRLGHQKQAVPHLPQLQSSQHAPNDLPRPRQPPMWAKGKEKKTIY